MAAETPTVKDTKMQIPITHRVPTIAGNSPELTALLDGMSVSRVLIEVPSSLSQAIASDITL